jgi:hypothetical protein
MNENILLLGYLSIRLTKEKERKNTGEQEINQRIFLLHANVDISIEIEDKPLKTYNKNGMINSAPVLSKEEYPDWAKRIEREIVKKTHPDKLSGRPKEEIEAKTEMFLKAKENFRNKKFVELLPIALSLGIDFEKYKDDFDSDIEKRIKEIQKEINLIQSSIAWQWFDLPENEKIKAIDIILKRSGIKKSKSEIKKAVNKRIKRKTGTRPKSLKEIRGLK